MRSKERCIECGKKMKHGSSASWCPDSYNQDATHHYETEHDVNDAVVGRYLVTGVAYYYGRSALFGSARAQRAEKEADHG